MKTFILIFQCRDQKGIVAKVSDFIFQNNGNIVSLDQYSTHFKSGHLFMRVEFMLEGKIAGKAGLEKSFLKVAKFFKANFKFYEEGSRLRMGVLVSKPGHCLAEILYLWKNKELNVEIPFVISNCLSHRELANQYKVPFYFVPSDRKSRREKEILRLVKDSTDFLVLARYMLILSGSFIKNYSKDIINIHHGFLPSFKGANPYQQALERGVKVIGATSHFVTEKLDCGPIITQEVSEVSHKDDLSDLLRKGRNLENRALCDALASYVQHRVIRFKNKTVIF